MVSAETILMLQTDELKAALALEGLWPDLASPLTSSLGLATTGEQEERLPPLPEVVARLRQSGVVTEGQSPRLTESFGRALHALAMPTERVVTCFGTSEALGAGRYFSRGLAGGDGLVFYRPGEDEMHHISFFHASESLLDSLDAYIGFAQVHSSPGSAMEMTISEYVTLLGLVDAHRTRSLEAMLRRERPSDWAVTAEDVRTMLRQEQVHHDLQWLVPLTELTMPVPAAMGDEDIISTLASLVERGYLTVAGTGTDGYRFHEHFSVLLQSLLSLVSFFFFGITRWRPDDAVWVDTYFTAFRSLLALWVVDYLDAESDSPMVRISTTDCAGLREALSELLTSAPAQPVARYCTQCGAELKAGAGFCTNCGARVG